MWPLNSNLVMNFQLRAVIMLFHLLTMKYLAQELIEESGSARWLRGTGGREVNPSKKSDQVATVLGDAMDRCRPELIGAEK